MQRTVVVLGGNAFVKPGQCRFEGILEIETPWVRVSYHFQQTKGSDLYDAVVAQKHAARR